MREFEALKKAVQMGVKAGIYSMEDVVLLHHSINVVGRVLDDAKKAESVAVTTPDEPSEEPKLETAQDEG